MDGNAEMPGKPLMLFYNEDESQFDVLKDIVPRPLPANRLRVKEVVTGPFKGMQATVPCNESSSFFEALALLLTDKSLDELQEKLIEAVVQKWDDLKYLIRSSNGLCLGKFISAHCARYVVIKLQQVMGPSSHA